MEKISFGVSIAAIIISIISPIFEYNWNKMLNKTNLEAEYFNKLYNQFLMQDFPEARCFLHYSDNNFGGINQLIEVLRDIRKKSIFFKYHNKTFYEEMLKLIQKIEDDLILNEGEMNSDTYVVFYTRLEKEIGDMYECITNRYLGK
ncbi:hypothetical protein [Lacrimispora sp.]|uniref:hypothetical protein n=1 Tax=Lacrimispora sp. TaxID=2719234 RepID=UPI0039918EAB